MARWQQNKFYILVRQVCFLLICASAITGNPIPEETIQTKEDGTYLLRPSRTTAGKFQHAAVATSSPQCAQVGAKILQKGGSAVDGAISTLLCDGVVSVQGMGIGGGFIMTIWNATTKTAHFLNAREYAPAAAWERIFTPQNAHEAKYGGKAIAVPGEIAGYWEAHQRYGKLPWKDLFEDTIKICREGSDVSEYTYNDIQKVKDDINNVTYNNFTGPLKDILKATPESPDFVKVHDKIKRLKLADTLQQIADNGSYIFYHGSIADDLVKDIKKAGGIITKEDFENYKPQWKDPISTTIKGKTLYSAPTPGSGVILAFMLKVLEGLIPAELDTKEKEKLMWANIAETFKWGYARRNELGDFIERDEYADKHNKSDCRIEPEKKDTLTEQGYSIIVRGEKMWDKDCLMSVAKKKLLSPDYIEEVREKVKEASETVTSNDYHHYEVDEKGRIDLGTAHTSVYAEDGSAVAVTSTINHLYGSLVRSESTGIILNNEMDDYSYPEIKNGFDMEPSEFNYVRSGRSTLRPMSSMSPTIILNEDKTVRLVIGSAGGTKITSGVCLGIIQNLFLGKDIKSSLDHPRIHHNLWPMAVQVEPEFRESFPDIVEHLRSRNHSIAGWNIMQNTLAAISVIGSNVEASGDYRRQGGAAGY